MPTEIQYGVEVGGREWALSRGGKHSNNTMKRRRRWRAKERGGGRPDLRQEMASNGFLAPSLLSRPHLPSVSLSVCVFTLFVPFFLYFSVFPHWCSAHWGSAEIRMCSPLDPAAETKQVWPDPVCVCVSVKVCEWGSFFLFFFIKKPPSVHLSLFHTFYFPFSRSAKELLRL